jgi:two-component system NtrC family response regulator
MRVGGSNTVTVDVRIVAATNKDIEKAVKDATFREDLLYRLDVVRIEMPLLKDRRDDIELLAQHFLLAMGGADASISPRALRVLQEYGWPGNVRELQNTIERAVIESEGNAIDVAHLRERLMSRAGDRTTVGKKSEGILDLETNEARIIEEALRKAGGNKSNAAKLLGITRRKLYSRMKLLGLDTSPGEA